MADNEAKKKAKLNELFNKLDTDGDGELTKDEVMAGAALLNMTPEEAAKMFDDLDEDKSGTLARSEFDAAASMNEEYEKMMAEVAALNAESEAADKAAAAAEEKNLKAKLKAVRILWLAKHVAVEGNELSCSCHDAMSFIAFHFG